jgi:hypothetical protein
MNPAKVNQSYLSINLSAKLGKFTVYISVSSLLQAKSLRTCCHPFKQFFISNFSKILKLSFFKYLIIPFLIFWIIWLLSEKSLL